MTDNSNENSFTSEKAAGESPVEILARVWPEFDSTGLGILASRMEEVLRRVEQEYQRPLMNNDRWMLLGDFMKMAGQTQVSKDDLLNLLNVCQSVPSDELNSQDSPAQDGVPTHLFSPQHHPHPYTYEQVVPDEVLRDEEQQRRGDYSPDAQHYLHPADAQSLPAEENSRPRSSRVHRPRTGNGVRKISLSESTRAISPRPPRHRHDPSQYDSDPHSEDEVVPRKNESLHDANYSRYDQSVSMDRNGAQEDRIEYVGWGIDAAHTVGESDLRLGTGVSPSVLKQLRIRELEVHELSKELKEEKASRDDEIERLARERKRLQQECSTLKNDLEFATSRMGELEKQVEMGDRTSSAYQKHAAFAKKQKDELSVENRLMVESLQQSEEQLHEVTARLQESQKDRTRIDEERVKTRDLEERLASEIVRSEKLELALAESEERRIAAEREATAESLLGINPESHMSSIAPGKDLMTELQSAAAMFGAGIPQSDEHSESQERAIRLLKESQDHMTTKRNSMRDLNQFYKDSLRGLGTRTLQDAFIPTSPVPPRQSNLGSEVTVSTMKQRAEDDVDCELPPELSLDTRQTLFQREVDTQRNLIEDIMLQAKVGESSTTPGSIFAGSTLGQNPELHQKLKVERARQRKAQRSRILTPADVVGLLNPGTLGSSPLATSSTGPAGSSTAVSKKDKNIVTQVTLMSMYTIIVYLMGVVTSVFLVDNGPVGGAHYGRFMAFDSLQDVVAAANVDMNGGNGRFKIVEVLVYWMQNLVWQGDHYTPT